MRTIIIEETYFNEFVEKAMKDCEVSYDYTRRTEVCKYTFKLYLNISGELKCVFLPRKENNTIITKGDNYIGTFGAFSTAYYILEHFKNLVDYKYNNGIYWSKNIKVNIKKP